MQLRRLTSKLACINGLSVLHRMNILNGFVSLNESNDTNAVKSLWLFRTLS